MMSWVFVLIASCGVCIDGVLGCCFSDGWTGSQEFNRQDAQGKEGKKTESFTLRNADRSVCR
jgi:hypothetical protein